MKNAVDAVRRFTPILCPHAPGSQITRVQIQRQTTVQDVVRTASGAIILLPLNKYRSFVLLRLANVAH